MSDLQRRLLLRSNSKDAVLTGFFFQWLEIRKELLAEVKQLQLQVARGTIKSTPVKDNNESDKLKKTVEELVYVCVCTWIQEKV